MLVDNFWVHIENQHILLVTISIWEKNWRTIFFSQLTLPFGHLDEFWGHFWMLHFVHLSLNEIEFSVCFNFSRVYARVFVDSHISTLLKKLKLLINSILIVPSGLLRSFLDFEFFYLVEPQIILFTIFF